jgi:hypothetical protein
MWECCQEIAVSVKEDMNWRTRKMKGMRERRGVRKIMGLKINIFLIYSHI